MRSDMGNAHLCRFRFPFPQETVLSIKDDGCSFNSSSANWKPGLGIRNMKQIAAGFDGEVEIQHNPGGGTLVLCTIPGPRTPSINYKEAIGV